MIRHRFPQAPFGRYHVPSFAVVLAALVALTVGARAGAQETGAALDQYRAAESSADGFAISRPDDLDHLRFSAQIHLDYANEPLEYEIDGDDAVVAHQLVGHFAFALGLIDRLVLFTGLPVSFLMTGDDVTGQPTPEGTNVGDLYLGLRGRLYGEPDDIFAVGLQATVTAPTAHAQADPAVFAGDRNFSGHFELLAELRLRRVRLTFNLGTRLREPIDFPSVSVGHELTYGLGLTVNIVDRWLLGLVEVFGASPFRHFATPEASPLEALIGGVVTIGHSWRIGLAAGPGLTNGFGAPDFRIVFNMGYTYGSPIVPEPEPEPEPELEPGPTDRD